MKNPIVESADGSPVLRDKIRSDETYVVHLDADDRISRTVGVQLVVLPTDCWKIEILAPDNERRTLSYKGGEGAEAICLFVDLVRTSPRQFAFMLRMNDYVFSTSPIHGEG